MEANMGIKRKGRTGAGWKKRVRLTKNFALICATKFSFTVKSKKSYY